jgi:hypothetical protein
MFFLIIIGDIWKYGWKKQVLEALHELVCSIRHYHHIYWRYIYARQAYEPQPLLSCNKGAFVIVILYVSWIYNYLSNQCLSPIMLRVRIPLRRIVLDATLCNIVCQWLIPNNHSYSDRPTLTFRPFIENNPKVRLKWNTTSVNGSSFVYYNPSTNDFTVTESNIPLLKSGLLRQVTF